MKKFICGDIRFSTSQFKGEALLLPVRKGQNEGLEEFKNEENILPKKRGRGDSLELSQKYKNLFIPTKQTHGFSGMSDEEYMYMSLHTTRPESNIWGYVQENISMGDTNNPIAGMNKIHKIRLDVFEEFFQVFNPDKMFSNLRYRTNSPEDLCYYSYLGFWRSILHSEEVIVIDRRHNEDIRVVIEHAFNADERGVIKLPAQIALEKWNYEVLGDIEKELSLLKTNQISKADMVETVRGNFKEFFKND